MVNRLRLNDKTVREQIPEEDRAYQVFDTEIRGLSIRVMPSSERSFVMIIALRAASAAWRSGVGLSGASLRPGSGPATCAA